MGSIWDFITTHAGGAASGGFSYLANGVDDDDIDPLHMFSQSDSEKLADDQWKWQKQKYEENFNQQQMWNQSYWIMQNQERDYQRALDSLGMQREDTAVQRRVADLKAAGLSPTLAAGSAADTGSYRATSVTPQSAPQFQVGENPRLAASMFKEQMMRDRIALVSSVLGNVANISKTAAETQLLKAQTDQITTNNPLDLKLKEQAYKFAEEANVYKLKSLALDVSSKQKDIDIKDFNLILMQDEHARNALDYFNVTLDSRLKALDIDLKDREYILKGLAIDAAITSNAKLQLEYSNLQYDTDFYHKRGMPVGINMGAASPLFGIGSWAHQAGYDFGQKVGQTFSGSKDFVSNLYFRARNAARRLTKGVFDFSE